MKLVVTEKNDAAKQIATLLGASSAKADKVFSTPIFRFTVKGEDWVLISPNRSLTQNALVGMV